MPSGAVLEGRGSPSNLRALACLVPHDSELTFLLRSLVKLSPSPPYGDHSHNCAMLLGLRELLQKHCAVAKWLCGRIYCLLEFNMLCDCVTRGCGDHSPLTTDTILPGMAKKELLRETP
jgi:hypothetical protein